MDLVQRMGPCFFVVVCCCFVLVPAENTFIMLQMASGQAGWPSSIFE